MAVFEKLVWAFRCERCGWEWIPRKPWSEGEELPTVCPSCKSPYWNRPRKVPGLAWEELPAHVAEAWPDWREDPRLVVRGRDLPEVTTAKAEEAILERVRKLVGDPSLALRKQNHLWCVVREDGHSVSGTGKATSPQAVVAALMKAVESAE